MAPSLSTTSFLPHWVRAASLSVLLLGPSSSTATVIRDANSPSSHTGPLTYRVASLSPPVVDVKINGVVRTLLVDSGSPDTFVYSKGITCIGSDKKPANDCAFGDDLYSGGFDPIDGLVFNQTYGTGQGISGPFGYASIEIAGVTVEKQRIAFADRSTKNTFPGAQGLLGMAPGGVLEAAWKGQNGSTVVLSGKTKAKYPTVFESMYNATKPEVKPFWSIALDRLSNSGTIAFGSSVPQASNITSWISTPFTSTHFNGDNSTDNYYTIQPDGYELAGKRISTDYPLAVDTGTFVSRLPADMADKVNAAFDPPAKYNDAYPFYLTSCNAKVPDFGLVINGKLIKPNAKDMLQPFSNSTCMTGITRPFTNLGGENVFPKGFQVLGDMFLNSFVTEFDLGKQEMRFGEREPSSSSSGQNSTSTTTGPSSSSSPSSTSNPKSGAGKVGFSSLQYLAVFVSMLVFLC